MKNSPFLSQSCSISNEENKEFVWYNVRGYNIYFEVKEEMDHLPNCPMKIAGVTGGGSKETRILFNLIPTIGFEYPSEYLQFITGLSDGLPKIQALRLKRKEIVSSYKHYDSDGFDILFDVAEHFHIDISEHSAKILGQILRDYKEANGLHGEDECHQY